MSVPKIPIHSVEINGRECRVITVAYLLYYIRRRLHPTTLRSHHGEVGARAVIFEFQRIRCALGKHAPADGVCAACGAVIADEEKPR